MKKFLNKYLSLSFSYHQIFFLVIVIASLRVIADWNLLRYPILMDVFQDYARFWLENVYYFLVAFLVLTVVCAKIIKAPLKEVMNVGIKFYPIIIFPPIFDSLLLGRTQGYTYGTILNLPFNVLTLAFATKETSLGISVEILIGMIGMFLYVYLKTKNVWKGIVFALFADVFFMVISTPDLFVGEWMGDYYYDYFLVNYYFFPLLILLILTLLVYDKKKLGSIFKNVRIVRSTIFVLTVFLGGIIRLLMKQEVYPLQLIYGSIAMFFAWQVAVIINDIYDIDIDRYANKSRPLVKGTISVGGYRIVASILSFLALSFAVIINIKIFFLIVLILIFAHIYSVPPVRARKNILGNVIIGISVLIAFLIGIYSSGRTNILTARVLFLAGIIFLFATALTLAKDIKDIEGDEKNGIKNLFTIYGKRKGKKITTILIFFILNVPAIVYLDLNILLFSLIAAGLFYKFDSIKSVYISGSLVTLLTVFDMFFTS